MSARPLPHRLLVVSTAAALAVGTLVATAPDASAASLTTAWHNGAFSENTGGVVSRSDIVLGKPNSADTQSLPLGNGSLGVAAWAALQWRRAAFCIGWARSGCRSPPRRAEPRCRCPAISERRAARAGSPPRLTLCGRGEGMGCR